MADKYWIGAAQAIAQVTQITFSAYTIGVTYRLTINNKTVSYTAVAATSADVWAGLVAAWQASVEPEHVEAIASVGGSGILLTSRTPGTPFTVTGSSSGAPTATVTPVTAATGPNSRTNAANWLGGTLPAAGDNLIFRNSAVSMLYDLVDTGTNFGNIIVDASFTGDIGLPATNRSGYPEYRPQFLKIGSAATYSVLIGQGTGRFPGRVMIDANGSNIAVQLYGSAADLGSERPVQLKNFGATSSVQAYGGYAGLYSDSTSTIASLNIVERADQQAKPWIELGSGVTATTVNMIGGSLNNYGTVTTLNATQQAQAFNYATMPTVKVASRSSVYWVSSAGLTSKAHVYDGGTLDFSRHAIAKAVQAVDLYAGGALNDPLGIVSFTTGIVLVGAKIADVTLDVNRSRTLTIA